MKQYFCCSGYCFIISCFIYCVVFIDLWAAGGLRGSGSSSQLKSWTRSSCWEIKAGQFISNASFILKKHKFILHFFLIEILSFSLLTVEVFNPVISLFIRISWRNIFLFLFVLFCFIDFCELKHSDSCWTSSQGTVVQFYLNLLTVSSWTVYQRHVWGFLTSLFFYRSFWFNSNLLMRSLSPHWLWIILLSAHLFIHSRLKSHFYIFVYCCLLFWWFSFIYDIYKFFLFRFKDQKGGNLTFMVEFYTQFL